MTDHEIIKIIGWANKDGRHDQKMLRRARDLVEASQREREAEIRAIAWLDEREAFEREMIRIGYDATSLAQRRARFGHQDQIEMFGEAAR